MMTNRMDMRHRARGMVGLGAVLALILVFAGRALAQFPGWDPRWPSPERMLAGCDPQVVQQFKEQSAILAKNPKDDDALVNRAVYAQRLARTSRFGTFWLWLAAKDLEQALAIDPNDFAAWHNYGDVNYSSGDFWPSGDHSNARRALTAFDKALALNPKSARSYMGRGWVYQDMDDVAHANADFQRALQLDPSLRTDMQKEIANIRERHRQVAAARGTVEQMSRYYVEKSARTAEECAKYIGQPGSAASPWHCIRGRNRPVRVVVWNRINSPERREQRCFFGFPIGGFLYALDIHSDSASGWLPSPGGAK